MVFSVKLCLVSLCEKCINWSALLKGHLRVPEGT